MCTFLAITSCYRRGSVSLSEVAPKYQGISNLRVRRIFGLSRNLNCRSTKIHGQILRVIISPKTQVHRTIISSFAYYTLFNEVFIHTRCQWICDSRISMKTWFHFSIKTQNGKIRKPYFNVSVVVHEFNQKQWCHQEPKQEPKS